MCNSISHCHGGLEGVQKTGRGRGGLFYLESLLMTRMSAPFSSFSLWLSAFKSGSICLWVRAEHEWSMRRMGLGRGGGGEGEGEEEEGQEKRRRWWWTDGRGLEVDGGQLAAGGLRELCQHAGQGPVLSLQPLLNLPQGLNLFYLGEVLKFLLHLRNLPF